jgi:hypothetical protein
MSKSTFVLDQTHSDLHCSILGDAQSTLNIGSLSRKRPYTCVISAPPLSVANAPGIEVKRSNTSRIVLPAVAERVALINLWQHPVFNTSLVL